MLAKIAADDGAATVPKEKNNSLPFSILAPRLATCMTKTRSSDPLSGSPPQGEARLLHAVDVLCYQAATSGARRMHVCIWGGSHALLDTNHIYRQSTESNMSC